MIARTRKAFQRFLLGIEYRWHMVDAYLAAHRGEMAFAADCECRAYDCQRRLDLLGINA